MWIIEYGRRILRKRKRDREIMVALERRKENLEKRQEEMDETLEEKEARIYKNRSKGQRNRRNRECVEEDDKNGGKTNG